jgi:hypothetical protein
MSEVGLRQRLTRRLGVVWPNHEQSLVLQAIFAQPEQARAAFLAWRGTLDITGPFDQAVMRLLPLLYLRMLEIGLNDPLMGRLKGVYRRAWSDTHALFHGTAPALSALRNAGIDTMLLKGVQMVLCHYRNFGGRPMADIDIAVRFDDVEAAVRALTLAGWTSAAPISRDHLAFRHAAEFRGPDGHAIDLHWHMLFTNCCARADALFWHDAQPVIFRDIATSAPSPTLALLHTLTHGMEPNTETPIRWIADALTLLRDPQAAVDWPLFCRTAETLGLSHRVLLALTYLRDCHAQEIPAPALHALSRARRTPAEALDLAVMTRRSRRPRPVVVDRILLVVAEYCRLARLRSGPAAMAMIPRFVRYRLGIVSWRSFIRYRLWRLKQGLRQALG